MPVSASERQSLIVKSLIIVSALGVGFGILHVINHSLTSALPEFNPQPKPQAAATIGIVLEPRDTGYVVHNFLRPDLPKLERKINSWLTEVDGQPVRGMTIDQIKWVLSGPQNSIATLTMGNQDKLETLDIARLPQSQIESISRSILEVLNQRDSTEPDFSTFANQAATSMESQRMYAAAARVRELCRTAMSKTSGGHSIALTEEIEKLSADYANDYLVNKAAASLPKLIRLQEFLIKVAGESGNNPPDAVALAMAGTAVSLSRCHHWDKAKPLLDIAIAASKNSPDPAQPIKVKLKLAFAQEAAGLIEPARQSYKEVVDWHDKHKSLNSVQSAVDRLVQISCQQGRPHDVELLVWRQADACKHENPLPTDYTKRLLNLANLTGLQGKLDIAEYTADCAINYWNEQFWLDPPRKAIKFERQSAPCLVESLCLGAKIDAKQQDKKDKIEEASKALNRALFLRERSLGAKNPLTLQVQNMLADLQSHKLAKESFSFPQPLAEVSPPYLFDDSPDSEQKKIGEKLDQLEKSVSAQLAKYKSPTTTTTKEDSLNSDVSNIRLLKRSIANWKPADLDNALTQGTGYLGQERFDVALAYFDAALIAFERLKPKDPQIRVQALRGAAACCFKLNNFQLESNYLKELVSLGSPTLSENDLLDSQADYINAYLKSGDTVTAQKAAHDLFGKIAERCRTNTPQSLLAILTKLSRCLYDPDHTSGAIELEIQNCATLIDEIERKNSIKPTENPYDYLALELAAEGKFDQLMKLFDQLRANKESDSPVWSQIIADLAQKNQADQAIAIGKHFLKEYDNEGDKPSASALAVRRSVIKACRESDRFEEAYPIAEKCFRNYIMAMRGKEVEEFFAKDYLPILTKLNKRLEAQACAPR